MLNKSSLFYISLSVLASERSDVNLIANVNRREWRANKTIMRPKEENKSTQEEMFLLLMKRRERERERRGGSFPLSLSYC